jgi:hypothetical protein
VTNVRAGEAYLLVQCGTYTPIFNVTYPTFFVSPTVVGSELPALAHAIEVRPPKASTLRYAASNSICASSASSSHTHAHTH